MTTEFIRFLVVGGTTALVQFLALAAGLEIFRLEYWNAAASAFVLSVVFHFLANRYFTFRRSGHPRPREVVRYLVLMGLNFLVTMCVTIISVSGLGYDPYTATVFSITATVLITFFSSRFWVFRI